MPNGPGQGTAGGFLGGSMASVPGGKLQITPDYGPVISMSDKLKG